MAIKKTTALGHFIYISIIIASLVYWKTQTQLQSDWMQYMDASNTTVTEFLQHDNRSSDMRNWHYIIRELLFSLPDTVLNPEKALCNLVNKMDTTINALRQLVEQPKSDQAINAKINELSQQWQTFTKVVSTSVSKDSALTNNLNHLLTPEAFEHWKSSFYRGNKIEKNYLLTTLKRLTNSAQSTYLRDQYAILKQQYGIPFDGVRMQMNPQYRPIAGQPFRAEFYPVWYATKIDSSYVMLDGRKRHFINGIAQFDKVFQTPGSKQIYPAVYIVNPRTGETNGTKKQFTIEVVK